MYHRPRKRSTGRRLLSQKGMSAARHVIDVNNSQHHRAGTKPGDVQVVQCGCSNNCIFIREDD